MDPPTGLRHGYSQSRRFTLTAGTITVRRPRVRELDERLVRRVLPFLKRRTHEVGDRLPQLYRYGVARGDVDVALQGLLGDVAPWSPASLIRLQAPWPLAYEAWKRRRLDDLEIVYVWVDS